MQILSGLLFSHLETKLRGNTVTVQKCRAQKVKNRRLAKRQKCSKVTEKVSTNTKNAAQAILSQKGSSGVHNKIREAKAKTESLAGKIHRHNTTRKIQMYNKEFRAQSTHCDTDRQSDKEHKESRS